MLKMVVLLSLKQCIYLCAEMVYIYTAYFLLKDVR